MNPQLNAVIHRRDERARAEADAAPPDGPFRGVPILVKDLDGALAGEPLHLGNRLLRDLGHVADHDSYLFARPARRRVRHRRARPTRPELGLLPTTESHAYGPAHNPWDLDPLARRIERRQRGGGRVGHGAVRARGRRRRLDPHPGQRVRVCSASSRRAAACRSVPTTARAWAGLVARHVVTPLGARQRRRARRASRAPCRAIRTPPRRRARPFADEVGAEPGCAAHRRAVEPRTGRARARSIGACTAAADDAAALLARLRPPSSSAAYPEPLDDIELLVHFTTVLAASTAYDLRKLGAMAGRELGPDDVEPLTWAQAELGRAVTADAYLEAVESLRAWSRRMARWWEPRRRAASTSSSRRPWRSRRRRSARSAATTPTARSSRRRPTPRSRCRSTSPASRRCRCRLWWARRPARSACSSSPRTGREDLLFRVAAQLEAARPWIDRRPPVHA